MYPPKPQLIFLSEQLIPEAAACFLNPSHAYVNASSWQIHVHSNWCGINDFQSMLAQLTAAKRQLIEAAFFGLRNITPWYKSTQQLRAPQFTMAWYVNHLQITWSTTFVSTPSYVHPNNINVSSTPIAWNRLMFSHLIRHCHLCLLTKPGYFPQPSMNSHGRENWLPKPIQWPQPPIYPCRPPSAHIIGVIKCTPQNRNSDFYQNNWFPRLRHVS